MQAKELLRAGVERGIDEQAGDELEGGIGGPEPLERRGPVAAGGEELVALGRAEPQRVGGALQEIAVVGAAAAVLEAVHVGGVDGHSARQGGLRGPRALAPAAQQWSDLVHGTPRSL